MGKTTVFSHCSSVTAFDMAAHQPLQDVHLDDYSSSELSPTMEPRPVCFRNVVHEILFVLAISLAGATFIFLQRSLVVIMDPLQLGLRISASELSWTVAGPGLAAGALFLPMTVFVERFRRVSRRTVLVGSLVVYAVLVGVCAASVNGAFLDCFLAVAGVMFALHLPTAMSILESAYPYRSRRKTVATGFFLASGNPTAIVLGSLLSGDVARHFGWRGSFVFLSVLSALAAVLALIVVPNFDRRSNLKIVRKGKGVEDEEDAEGEEESTETTGGRLDFDWRGMTLLILAVGLFTVALTSAPESHGGWSTPYIWLLFALSVVCLGMFVYWEKVSPRPLIPPPVWDHPGLLAMLVFVFLISMAGCALIFWVPLFMETVQLQSSFHTAVRLLPAAATGICVTPWLSLFLHKLNYGLVAAVSAFCMIASNVALMYLRSDRDYWVTTFPAMILSTVAMDWTLTVATAAFASALPLHHQTAGLGLVVTVARLAIPAGLAVTTAIHTSFAGRSDMTYPEVPYTNVFYATLSLAVLALTLVPFLQFGNRPSAGRGNNNNKKLPLSMVVNFDASEDLDYWNFSSGHPLLVINPRKSSLYVNYKHQAAAAATAETEPKTPQQTQFSGGGEPSKINNLQRAASGGSRRSSAAADRVIWLVCEDCGASKRMVETVGDPVRYFYDGDEAATEAAESRSLLGLRGSHQGGGSGSSGNTTVRRVPLCKDVNSFRGR
ncbi:major facilitator superfamily domain-containing protein [Coniochaeta sp. 2T2.1]|nr:major facilitator superfamily domain-containing protein [Coniochaeta sp. 2T2.1]